MRSCTCSPATCSTWRRPSSASGRAPTSNAAKASSCCRTSSTACGPMHPCDHCFSTGRSLQEFQEITRRSRSEPFLNHSATAEREKDKTMKTIKIANVAKTAVFATVAAALALGLAGPADAAAGTMYGDPTAAAQWWRHQKFDDCVIMASADLIGQITGREPSEQAIIKKAQSTPSTLHPGSIYIKPANANDP